MKRIAIFSALCLLSAAPLLRAQDAAAVAAAASRQEAQENYNQLKGYVDDLLKSQKDMDFRIQALSKDIADLRIETSKPTGNYASQEEVQALKKAIEEIDKKREQDKELILKEIEKIGKAVTAGGPAIPSSTEGRGHKRSRPTPTDSTSIPDRATPPSGNSPSGDEGDQTGFYYIVKSGDTLGLIAQAYREQGIKVSSSQIARANPNVNPAKLYVGTKIFIPAPKGSTLRPTK